MGESGRVWERVGESGREWERVGESGREWERVGESGREWERVLDCLSQSCSTMLSTASFFQQRSGRSRALLASFSALMKPWLYKFTWAMSVLLGVVLGTEGFSELRGFGKVLPKTNKEQTDCFRLVEARGGGGRAVRICQDAISCTLTLRHMAMARKSCFKLSGRLERPA